MIGWREGKSLSEAVDEAGVFSKVYSTAILAGRKERQPFRRLGLLHRVPARQHRCKKENYRQPGLPGSFDLCRHCCGYLPGNSSFVPKFALLYNDLGVELPGPTKFLITITVSYRYHILGALVLLVLAGIGIFFWSRSEQGGVAFDRMLFKLPVIGETLLKFQVAQFCRTLATLLTGGTPLVAALSTSAEAISSRLIRGTVGQATPISSRGRIASRIALRQPCNA